MKIIQLIFRLCGGLLLLTTVVGVLALAAGKVLPYMGELAYVSTSYNHIFLMDVQRQFSVDFSRPYVNDCCLTWSPDGRALTMVVDMSSDGSTDIFTMDFHSPMQRLTTLRGADLYPAYSPDGRQIAYTGYGYGDPQLYLMNADGTDQHALTGGKGVVNLNPYPVWSPDGQSVLFSDFGNIDSLFAVPADCSEPCDSSIHSAFSNNGLGLMITSFLPLDQSRLVMAAIERTPQGGYGIYVLDSGSTRAPQRLTVNSDLASPSVAVRDHWVAFVSGNITTSEIAEENSLYILDADCISSVEGCMGQVQRVAGQIKTDDNLSWSPDGRWLAFVTVANNISHLNLFDSTCLDQKQDCTLAVHTLDVTSARYIRPAWRPYIR